jgi:hypothetical protein
MGQNGNQKEKEISKTFFILVEYEKEKRQSQKKNRGLENEAETEKQVEKSFRKAFSLTEKEKRAEDDGCLNIIHAFLAHFDAKRNGKEAKRVEKSVVFRKSSNYFDQNDQESQLNGNGETFGQSLRMEKTADQKMVIIEIALIDTASIECIKTLAKEVSGKSHLIISCVNEGDFQEGAGQT